MSMSHRYCKHVKGPPHQSSRDELDQVVFSQLYVMYARERLDKTILFVQYRNFLNSRLAHTKPSNV